ncbi:unnamed protein product [Caenorhabditis sp. 36 PRJEB53466]|nr:unnamed protein product [Caenorhabditis sp. 36 PRJEB53466]
MRLSIQFILVLLLFTAEAACLTMLGLTRGSRGSTEEKMYFPAEDNLPPPLSGPEPELDKTYVRRIGSVAGREIIPRAWEENEEDRKRIRLDADGMPVRPQPVVSRMLGRPGGL